MRSPEFSSAEFLPEPKPFDENSVGYEELIEGVAQEWEPFLETLRTHEALALLTSESLVVPALKTADLGLAQSALENTIAAIEIYISDIQDSGMIEKQQSGRVRRLSSMQADEKPMERWSRLDSRIGSALSEIEQRLSYLKDRSERKGIIAWILVNERSGGRLRETVREQIDSGQVVSNYEVDLELVLRAESKKMEKLSREEESDITPLIDGEMTSLPNQRRAS